MKRRWLHIALLALVFLAGLSLLLYPLLSDRVNQRRSDALLRSYTDCVAAAPESDSAEWLDRAAAYNAALPGKGVPDAFSDITPEEDADYLSQLAFSGDGVMGFLTIPRISVSLPIYHGTAPETLERGVGHLQGSALPVGGADTHCVLSAHRGLPSASLFTDLDQLSPGDHFYLYVLDRVLAYEVDSIQEVLPTETEALDVLPGEDLVTLVTCTPYGVNTHRLLVRGRRAAYEPETAELEQSAPVRSVHTRYGLWAAAGLAAVAALAAVLAVLAKKKGGRA